MLTLTGFLLRALGMAFRVYISAKIGEEGMGVYQLITSAYFLFITLAQSGLSVTVTRLCASKLALKDYSESRGVLKNALVTSAFTGFFAMALMLCLAKVITLLWINDLRALYSLYVLSFSLPAISVCSVLSGYFIANKNVTNGCTSQIIEQLSRLLFAGVAIYLFKDAKLSHLLAAVLAANTLSEILSLAYLGICLFLQPKTYKKSEQDYKKQIIKGAYPIALSRYLASGLHTAENMLVPSAITLFTKSRSIALSQFGALKGMALPLLFFPFSFINALSTLLVPEISDACALEKGERAKTLVKRTCHITLTLSVMAGGLFFVFAKELGLLIYKSEKVVDMLYVLSPIVPFMYLDSICDGLLKGLGKQKQVLYNNCIDSALRIVLIALLVPRLGMSGFLIVMLFSNITVSLLNFRLLMKSARIKCDVLNWWIKPFVAAGISAILTKILVRFGTKVIKIALGSVLFCAFFGMFIILFGYKSKKSQNL